MKEDYKSNKSIGSEKRGNLNYIERAKSQKTTEVICTPDSLITAVNAAAGALVGKGNLCRVFGTTSSLVVFGNSSVAAPTTTTPTAALMSQACQIFVASDDFIRTTNDVTRVEIILD